MNLENLARKFEGKSSNQAETFLKLEEISYEWVDKTESIPLLKKGIKLIEDDGNYFNELKRHIEKKIKLLQSPDSKLDQKNDFETPSKESEEKEKAVKELSDWVMVDSPTKENQEEQKSKSEEEKNKGNDSLRAGDIHEAITHYTKAVNFFKGKLINLIRERSSFFKQSIMLYQTQEIRRSY